MNKLKLFLFSFLLVVCFGISNKASAQTFSSNTNVDALSDDVIRQYMAKAQQSGLSDDQLMQMARSSGVSDVQVQHLQARIADIRKKDANSGNGAGDGAQVIRKFNDSDTAQIRQQNNTPGFKGYQTEIFGASLFRNNTKSSFQPNLKLPTPQNYVVGTDDQLQIGLSGKNVANWNLTVSPEGNINIPNVGPLNVSGKTIEQATELIKSKLIANRYTIGSGTNMQVTLGNIRSISVIMQGQFVTPGTYTLTSLSTVFNALNAAGGPSDIGSFRNIEVIRRNKVISHVDLYDFLVNGTQKGNIVLQNQDVIRVPTYDKRVELKGEVKIPALFEVLQGETLQDVINFAGGFTDAAYADHIKVTETRNGQRAINDVFEAQYKSYIPKRGDKFLVDKVLDRYENRVTIKGAIFRPNEYELKDGLTLSALIKNAGGLKEDAFTGRGGIIRLKPDNTLEELSFNLADVIQNKPGADQTLQREDIVTITSIFDLRDQYKVTIRGEVRKPDDYAYADNMKVADLIIKASGFAEGASTKHIEVSRRIYDSDPHVSDSKIATVYNVDIDNNLKTGDGDFTLKPYDIVSVYSLPGFEVQKTVKLEGEIIYPGEHPIRKKNERVSDIIAEAGGLTASADVDGSSLKRDNNASVLGSSKAKIDTAELNKERADRLDRLKRNYKDSTNINTVQQRNNFVGIDLRKILANPGSPEDLILEDGDILRVPKQQQTVKVNGEVLFPSAVVYSGGKTLKEYILNAGGFSPEALKNAAYVVYSNGTVKGTRKFLFFVTRPIIKPGSEIYVPKKPVKNAVNATEILGFATGLASLGAIILGILSLNK